jgi:hypothetical protein
MNSTHILVLWLLAEYFVVVVVVVVVVIGIHVLAIWMVWVRSTPFRSADVVQVALRKAGAGSPKREAESHSEDSSALHGPVEDS